MYVKLAIEMAMPVLATEMTLNYYAFIEESLKENPKKCDHEKCYHYLPYGKKSKHTKSSVKCNNMK